MHRLKEFQDEDETKVLPPIISVASREENDDDNYNTGQPLHNKHDESETR